MTYLPGGVAPPLHQLAAEHGRPPDPGPEGETEEVGDAHPGPELPFGVGPRPGVVRPRTRGPPARSPTRRASGTSRQPRLGAWTTVPVRGSTWAATATPTARGGSATASRQARAERTKVAITPPGPSFAWRWRPLEWTTRPRTSTSPLTTLVAPRSIPRTRSEPGDAAALLVGEPPFFLGLGILVDHIDERRVRPGEGGRALGLSGGPVDLLREAAGSEWRAGRPSRSVPDSASAPGGGGAPRRATAWR